MKLIITSLLFLVIAASIVNVEGSKCKCSRKGPKIRFTDVQKLEIKPKYPYCEEKMIIVTMQNVSRFRGQQYCLHPKLHSTKKFLKWYTIWKEKNSYPLNKPHEKIEKKIRIAFNSSGVHIVLLRSL